MTQYQNDKPITKTPVSQPKRDSSIDQELDKVKQQLRQQAAGMADLEREIKKIKNELRVAINAFNAKHNG